LVIPIERWVIRFIVRGSSFVLESLTELEDVPRIRAPGSLCFGDPLKSQAIHAIFNRLSCTEVAPEMAKNDTVDTTMTGSRPVIAGDRLIAGRHERPVNRFEGPESAPSAGHEEILVVDDRAALRPAQVVESKLARLLQEASLPVSHLQMRGLLRSR
jgi:hypothetical protein